MRKPATEYTAIKDRHPGHDVIPDLIRDPFPPPAFAGAGFAGMTCLRSCLRRILLKNPIQCLNQSVRVGRAECQRRLNLEHVVIRTVGAQ